MPHLVHLVYVSDAKPPMSLDELAKLQELAAQRNSVDEITGVLLYGNGHFMQLLEGPLHRVNKTYARILIDPRHIRIQQLMFHPVRRRQFEVWDLQLINLNDSDRLDRRRLGELLDRQAEASLSDISGFHNATQALIQEFRRQLVPGA